MTGGIRVVGIYAEKLRQMGHDVTIYSVARKRPLLRRQLKRLLRGETLRPWAKHLPSFLDRMDVTHVRLGHRGPIRAADLPDADVVVATWWETAHWAAALPAEKGAKVYFMQDYGAKGQELEKVAPTWRLPLHKVTIAEWLAALIRDHVPEAEVDVVGNSVDLDLFDVPPRERQPAPRIGFMYRKGASKGAGLALEALARARRDCPGLQAVSFGNREHTLHDLGGVEFHDRPPDTALPGLYASCDAWIFPSLSEGYGLPILEAMACRTPVIATPAGAAPELVTPDRGILLPDYEPDSMAAAIVAMARMDPGPWAAMSAAARAAVEAYTWDDAARLFEAALIRAREARTRD